MNINEFMTWAYGFAGFWLVLFVLLGMKRPGKNREDYEVIGFRAASGFICTMVFLRRFFEWDYTILIIPLIVYCYTAMRNTISFIMHILEEDRATRP